MSLDPVDRLLDEARGIPEGDDPADDALRQAILVEDVLGVVLSDEQIVHGALTDPARLRSLVAAAPVPG